MSLQDWTNRWSEGRIGFHLAEVNPHLIEHWQKVTSIRKNVFVPLCGKSQDLMWLQKQGLKVVGAELVEVAVESFFNEQQLNPKIEKSGSNHLWCDDGINIYQGDFFTLPIGEISSDVFYDRAALIALPRGLRQQYVNQLLTVASELQQGLLVTLDYDQNKVDGPPYSVPKYEVEQLFSKDFIIQKLSETIVDTPPGFRKNGIMQMQETVYKLTKK
ncbi:thiopurine S-methyltransferase [Parashewanella spongiae]|uniref:Thiopurine S-methyltransferase n=1 Tax=Parashewanella spongiae TaxID=342950 RepID=A0A3A6TR05_9GAMM|nr:thiopurine S-methyltransferase [Parashewanella spongiae]MCL1079552.1 thiopurine S-methyltransferase [Parashewanella spongiae]RJY18457.1 thiopurine S-methyltransferase [Parashewanella spongiae]